jgi:hypothetical protein
MGGYNQGLQKPVAQRVQDPLDFSSQYNTPLNSQQQVAYNVWAADRLAKTGKDPNRDKYDYDVNGFFLSGADTAANGHGTDQFKKPNHPTFSNESRYHGKDGNTGGAWMPSGARTMYMPSATNMKHRSYDELQKYFQEVEPDVVLGPAPLPQPAPQRMLQPGRYGLQRPQQ